MHARPFIAKSALLLAALACRDDAETPTEPSSVTPLASASAAVSLAFRQIDGGGSHGCGVTTGGDAYCWGNNYDGQLGDGTRIDRREPTPVSGGLQFRQISAGDYHTCAVTPENRAYCWGWNGRGVLGDGTTTDYVTPHAVGGGRVFRQVSVGGDYTCAVNPYGAAFCWGDNSAGALGTGDTTNRLLPVRVQSGVHRFRQVSAGTWHACGVTTDDRAYCWGDNRWGQIGDGTRTRRLKPVAVSPGRRFLRITAHASTTCGVTTDNRIFCWGNNRFGQIGDGTAYPEHPYRKWPQLVKGGLQWNSVSPAGTHTCGVTTGNVGYCWGWNLQGQLGDGTTEPQLTPVPVAGDHLFRQLSGRGYFTCGVSTDNAGYCWGSNNLGQLGDGTTTNRLTPTPIKDPL